MIHPNMATMLAFVTTDVAISKEMLNTVIQEVVADTFNMVSVDGDTSTNDMLSVMANGLAKIISLLIKMLIMKFLKKLLCIFVSVYQKELLKMVKVQQNYSLVLSLMLVLCKMPKLLLNQ